MADRRTLIGRAREFRRTPTRGERALWAALRGKTLGVRFYRQQIIGPFVADFACGRPRLVVEVDGPVHEAQQERDAQRQRYLEDKGYRVERVSDEDAEHRTDAVLQRLRTILAELRDVPDQDSPSRLAEGQLYRPGAK